jgi:hypothetical protein
MYTLMSLRGRRQPETQSIYGLQVADIGLLDASASWLTFDIVIGNSQLQWNARILAQPTVWKKNSRKFSSQTSAGIHFLITNVNFILKRFSSNSSYIHKTGPNHME